MPQRPPTARRTTRVLEVHVPRLTVHVHHRRHREHGPARPADRVRQQRNEHLQPSPEHDVRPIPPALSATGSRPPVQPGRHQSVPLLPIIRRGPVPRTARHRVDAPLAQLRPRLGLCRFRPFHDPRAVLPFPHEEMELELGLEESGRAAGQIAQDRQGVGEGRGWVETFWGKEVLYIP